MIGNGDIKYVTEEIKYNKVLIYDNIDTSKGQSGCPIFKINENKNDEKYDEKKDNNTFKGFDELVGIHVAKKTDTKRLNYGTFLNKTLRKWIYECINVDNIKYALYDIGVLLITPCKSKYGHILNEIHKKCLKTEIMNTMRVYYDYTIEESVHKKDILFYIKQFFQTKRQSYLIFYCGESDSNGNWTINNNKSDNITLEYISLCK